VRRKRALSGAQRAFTDADSQSRSRNVVVEFPDYETALACYRSTEYQQNMKVRQAHSTGDLIVIEGFDGVVVTP
jgi:uncharacterized protein (DUF1330 family)